MSRPMKTSTLREIDYPESDGTPMAETPLHMRVMWDSIQTLNYWYADDPRVYVWGNMFLYYVRGNPRRVVSPDIMVVKAVEKDKPRNVFKTWEEKRCPSAVIEITSRKTKNEDQKTKFQLYRDVLKVKEYFLFDPRAEYVKQALKGYRLSAGNYAIIEDVDGRLPSKMLDLHLQRNGQELRFWNPATEAWLPTPEEVRKHAQSERDLAVRERDLVERELELERYKRALADSENERLRQELDTLRRPKNS